MDNEEKKLKIEGRLPSDFDKNTKTTFDICFDDNYDIWIQSFQALEFWIKIPLEIVIDVVEIATEKIKEEKAMRTALRKKKRYQNKCVECGVEMENNGEQLCYKTYCGNKVLNLKE